MQTAAVTGQAALTGSPRVSATMAKATAPRRATPIQVSFSPNSRVLLPLGRVGFVAGVPPRISSQRLALNAGKR